MLGLSIPEVAGRGRIDPAAAALIARMSVAPGAARAGAIDAAVRALKTAGVWGKLHGLWGAAAHHEQAARLNWIADTCNLSAVNSPAFVVDRHFAGDGAASYLDSGLAPAAIGQDSIAFGIWSRESGQAAGAVAGWYDGTGGVTISPRDASDRMVGRVNQAAEATSAASGVTDGSGLFAVNRSASNAVQGYRAGVPVFAAATASNTPSAGTLCIGRVAASAYRSRQIAAMFAGTSLTAAEHAALHQALAAYLTAVGAA